MTKIQSTPQSTLPTSLVSTPDEPKEGLTPTPTQGQTTTSTAQTSEKLLNTTENTRQATTNNPEATKLTGGEGIQQSQTPTQAPTAKPMDPVEKAKAPATPFEEVPTEKLTNSEARTELLALEKTGQIDVEFTDKGETRLFVPMFNVNYKKETEKSTEKPISSFLFSKAQDALSLSRLSEWASLKGIKEIIFSGFSSKDKTKSNDAPTSETSTPAPKPAEPKPAETKPVETQPVTAQPVAPKPVEAKPAPTVQQPTTPAATTTVPKPSTPAPTTQAAPVVGVPKPSTPAPAPETTPATIPLSRLQTGGIGSSTSAIPLKKPTETKTSVPKPSTPPPSMTATRLAMSQTQSQRDAKPLTATSKAPLTQEQATTGTATTAQGLSTTATTKPTNLEASLRSQVATPAPATTAPKAQMQTTTEPAKPKTSLSTLGSRLDSLLKKPATSRTSDLASLSSKLADVFKDRPSTSLWNMNIKGYRGEDPKTGKVIDVHGNRDMIRFNHYNYLDSVRSNRTQVAQETQKQQEIQREQQTAAQRAEEQAQLRTLLELEQMRRLDSVMPAPTQVDTTEEFATPRLENVGDQQQVTVQDVHTRRLQHQWDDNLTKK
ncbi:MAG: hypothetical protein EP343_32340 [Deltaproteobacteria bacterium]|nr:MAG: hypothetical protein EP343_32340 [Deltaproteobacteria bacterium]